MSQEILVNLRSRPQLRKDWKSKRHHTVERGKPSLFPLDESSIIVRAVEFDDNTLLDLHDFARMLERHKPANANVLDGFLQHKLLIPDSWKEFRRIWFFGTTYEHKGATLVRGLKQSVPSWAETELPFALPFLHGDAVAYRR